MRAADASAAVVVARKVLRCIPLFYTGDLCSAAAVFGPVMQVSESTKEPLWGGAVRRGPAPGRPKLMAAWEAAAGHGPHKKK